MFDPPILTYSFVCVVTNFFFLWGLAQAWENWDKSRPGRCNNINAQSWASAGWNIVLDLVVVILPMPMLWRMNLNPRKKFLVMLMFGTFLLASQQQHRIFFELTFLLLQAWDSSSHSSQYSAYAS